MLLRQERWTELAVIDCFVCAFVAKVALVNCVWPLIMHRCNIENRTLPCSLSRCVCVCVCVCVHALFCLLAGGSWRKDYPDVFMILCSCYIDSFSAWEHMGRMRTFYMSFLMNSACTTQSTVCLNNLAGTFVSFVLIWGLWFLFFSEVRYLVIFSHLLSEMFAFGKLLGSF